MSFMDDPGGHYPLDRKLAQLRADFGEDIAVYDYADDGLIESTAGLEEDMNDFNDETFGMDTVDKDFDFSGSTAQYLGVSEPPKQKPQGGASWTTMSSLLADREPGGSSTPRPSSPPRRKAGPVSLLDDPLLAPKSTISHRHSSGPFTPPKPPGSAPATTISKPHKIRTLEEIEAELRANSAAKNSIPSSSLPPQALTLEQVEAALLANHERKLATTTASRSSTPHALPFSQPSLQGRTPSVQHIQRNINLQPVMSSPVMAPMTRPSHTPSSLPPHNHPAHPAHPQHSEWLRLQQQQHQMYTNIPTQQHMPIQPLMSRLPAMPSPPQVLPGRHLSNPPGVGFGPNMRAGSVPPRSATQTPFVQASNVTIPVEELRSAAEARIQEQERREALRRRKAAKIAEMSKYNNLMSQGDKDFITRIQVSQLVNPSHGQVGFDPYADDFYFHVYSAIRASRMAAQHQFHTANAGRRTHTASSDERISQDYDGVGGFEPVRNSRTVERRLTRRDHAMIRMAQNVQRIIDHAKERPKMSQVSLEGALGKISLRTRSAPRQMLQVQPTSSDDLTTAAGGENHPGALAGSLPNTTPIGAGQPAMRHRQILMSLERLYSTVLEVEQLRRTQPNVQLSGFDMEEANSQLEEWEAQYESQKEKIWKQLRVLDPLGISHPHPFVSLISVPKGKRVLPRVIRLLNREQSLQVLTLLVATFESLDVVSDARLLDLPSESPFPLGKRSRPEFELETELFMNCVVAPMMTVINEISLDLVTGLVSLLMARNDLMLIARSKAGIAFLTLFLSRAELLRSAPPLESQEQNDSTLPSHESILRWQGVFNQLFHYLSSDFPSLFPSTRLAGALSLGAGLPPQAMTDSLEMNQKYMRPGIDLEDEPVWQLMAALAVSTDSDGQQTLVGGLRGKVLENVIAVSKKSVSDEIGAFKIRNVNLMLHALGLDASMIKL
ncbi:uncharacterized protein PGTG_04057 [Puccinia graminis f. sp. tritici CRL 75-36-700-3]|uniref:mRNA decay factor PAT1 domain-containing protein n=1 Tax=Puccinia graminis f. sp. tritici (strain CRL 75-36-700-3 / race SCCL) TaxID=418459 RepID=E3K1C6_PUCGT|nr:uncharacterized protein PGTG_04057 [Puccinia graminis f. sp. tritici CRL 75-36-700-3]EFP78101.2 hypothetical protein PGTG_04057 [Puccinia graminis f. sp. tritici CRL 75-36-700-3]